MMVTSDDSHCPHCGAEFGPRAPLAVMLVKCRQCQNEFPVPGIDSTKRNVTDPTRTVFRKRHGAALILTGLFLLPPCLRCFRLADDFDDVVLSIIFGAVSIGAAFAGLVMLISATDASDDRTRDRWRRSSVALGVLVRGYPRRHPNYR